MRPEPGGIGGCGSRLVARLMHREIARAFPGVTDSEGIDSPVDKLVNAIIRCVEAPKAANRTYHVSDGEDMSMCMLGSIGDVAERETSPLH